jgi:hypothetical protein
MVVFLKKFFFSSQAFAEKSTEQPITDCAASYLLMHIWKQVCVMNLELGVWSLEVRGKCQGGPEPFASLQSPSTYVSPVFSRVLETWNPRPCAPQGKQCVPQGPWN